MELIHPNDKLSISINQENPLWCAAAAIKKSLPQQLSISRWAEPDRVLHLSKESLTRCAIFNISKIHRDLLQMIIMGKRPKKKLSAEEATRRTRWQGYCYKDHTQKDTVGFLTVRGVGWQQCLASSSQVKFVRYISVLLFFAVSFKIIIIKKVLVILQPLKQHNCSCHGSQPSNLPLSVTFKPPF